MAKVQEEIFSEMEKGKVFLFPAKECLPPERGAFVPS